MKKRCAIKLLGVASLILVGLIWLRSFWVLDVIELKSGRPPDSTLMFMTSGGSMHVAISRSPTAKYPESSVRYWNHSLPCPWSLGRLAAHSNVTPFSRHQVRGVSIPIALLVAPAIVVVVLKYRTCCRGQIGGGGDGRGEKGITSSLLI